MKRLTCVSGLIAFAMLTVAGCTGGTAATTQQEIVIYSAEEMFQDFAEKYMEEHEGVTVTVVAGSSGESNARVAAEKDDPQGDLSVSGTDPSLTNPELYVKASEGLDLSGVDDRFRINDFAAPLMVYPVIFAYNKDQLNGDAPPTTWQELADPKWKGRLFMGNPSTSEAAYKAMVTFKELGGWELVEKIAKNAVITEGSTDPMRALGNGEAAVGIGVENQVYKWVDDETVLAVYPTDGMIMHVGTTYLIANPPNGDAGKEFVQWALTPEFQLWMSSTYRGVRSSLKDPAPAPNVPAVEDLKILEFSQEARDERVAYNEKWKEIVTAS